MSKRSMLLISLVLLLGVLAGTSVAQEPGADARVPTLSQWGLIAMGVALVTVGAIVIVWRKRRIAA